MDTRLLNPSKLRVVFAVVAVLVPGDAVVAADDAPVGGGSARADGGPFDPGNTCRGGTARGDRIESVVKRPVAVAAACHMCRGA